MSTIVTIPIISRQLGVTELTEREAGRIRTALTCESHRLVEIIGALINIHKKDYNDTRAVREKFRHMRVELQKKNGDYALICTGVPRDCLYDGEHVIEQSVEQVSSAMRDIVFPPAPKNGLGTSEERSAYVKKFVEHSGMLYRGERGLVVFTWGGHRVSREEYDFAKVLAYWLGLFMPDMENITGCGDGIMKAPFKGVQVAYGKQRTFKRFGMRDYIGFTEQGILAAEAPNELVNRLVVFPTIEQRMEAFIRASHRGRAHPGGPGTIEEIMTMLALLSNPENQNIPFSFEMVEETGGVYFKELDEYLRICFKDALDGLYDVFCCEPQTYARHVAETTRKLPMRYLWNDDFHFEERLQTPFEVSFESMEALDLSRNQEACSLLINLRRFFSAVVHLSVKDPDMLDSWGDERPLIRGDRDILRATDDLVKKLERQGRIHPEKKYATPYRVA
ncbi:pyrimidine/purine nucleotide monophosphate nucleosidase domain-containing protein [Paucidesulfovibrio longus]|uniref:pyrimidine/purine nucleotide monophosphate nucleosidase domain-containing protein n=1 Tax=Paucidesulfovibrio longus TaxID=889 RepID=UPI0003B7099A|nr:pyrimidine/purine nucleotide monophosphate nucleosidase domain-containing protein [Paucidesulfovibrio longus]